MTVNEEINKSVLNAVKILAMDKITQPEDAIKELTLFGFSPIEAEKFFFFIPLAFGRKILTILGMAAFPNECLIDTVDKKQFKIFLNDESIYICAVNMADKSFSENYLPVEIFQPVSLWSSELNVANEALKQGSDIKGGTFAIPIFFSTLKKEIWMKD